MTIKQMQLLFYSAAVFNWLAALLLFAPLGLAAVIGLEPLPIGGPYEGIMIAAIVVFGVGYFWVARSPRENISVVKLGLLGKLSVVAVIYFYGFTGVANLHLVAMATGDLLYSVFFAIYLINIDKTRYAS
jgi:hypothetical protein